MQDYAVAQLFWLSMYVEVFVQAYTSIWSSTHSQYEVHIGKSDVLRVYSDKHVMLMDEQNETKA